MIMLRDVLIIARSFCTPFVCFAADLYTRCTCLQTWECLVYTHTLKRTLHTFTLKVVIVLIINDRVNVGSPLTMQKKTAVDVLIFSLYKELKFVNLK